MTLLSRGNGGNMNIDLPCQSCDRASIASASGSEIGDINWGRCMLYTVANMSTVGVPHVPKIWVTISGWRLHFVVMGWFGQDRLSAITFRQPGMCLAPGYLCLEFVTIGTDPLLDVTGYGKDKLQW